MFGISSKVAAVGAAALLGALSTHVARSADGGKCRASATFTIVAFVKQSSGLAYEIRTNVYVKADADHQDVYGAANLSGPAGDYSSLNLQNLHVGHNLYIRWISPNGQSSSGKYEKLHLDIKCDGDIVAGVPELTANPVNLSARVYKPGEPRPFIQPWVNGCPDALVVDSRGSNEQQGTISPPGAAFVNELRLQYYEHNFVGRQGQDFVIKNLASPYQAKGGILKYILAKLPLPLSYRRSKAAGVKWLKGELVKLQDHCRHTSVYLSGYSQGAQVVGDVYQDQRWSNVHGAAMFGDLRFDPTDLSDHGNFDRTPHGLLGHLRHGYLRARAEFGSSRVWTFCHLHDPACQGATQAGYGFRYHKYTGGGEPEMAARYFWFNP